MTTTTHPPTGPVSAPARFVRLFALSLVVLVGVLLVARAVRDPSPPAMAEDRVPVLTALVPLQPGMSAARIVDELEHRVEVVEVDESARLPDALVDFAALSDLAERGGVVGSVVDRGGQLTESSFVTPREVVERVVRSDADKFEVALGFDPARSGADTIHPGQRVALVGVFEGAGFAPDEVVIVAAALRVTMSQVLAPPPADADQAATVLGPEQANTSRKIVTLEVDTAALERVLWAAEFGVLRIVGQGESATLEGSSVKDRWVVLDTERPPVRDPADVDLDDYDAEDLVSAAPGTGVTGGDDEVEERGAAFTPDPPRDPTSGSGAPSGASPSGPP